MQFMNDDMDELFRRAAENYPLDTRGADFSKVASALQNSDEGKVIPKKKGNRGKLLWLMLLLPMAFVCNQYLSPGRIDNGTAFNPAPPVKASAGTNIGSTGKSNSQSTKEPTGTVEASTDIDPKQNPDVNKALVTKNEESGISAG